MSKFETKSTMEHRRRSEVRETLKQKKGDFMGGENREEYKVASIYRTKMYREVGYNRRTLMTNENIQF